MYPTTQLSVLVVEDSEDDLFFLRRLLKKAGMEIPIAVATDGQEAIDYMQRAVDGAADAPVPHLVLLDLKLPLKSGFEVLHWIRAHPTLARVAVVILSSSAEARDVAQAYAGGAQGYWVKHPGPSAIAELLRRMAEVSPSSGLHNLIVPEALRP